MEFWQADREEGDTDKLLIIISIMLTNLHKFSPDHCSFMTESQYTHYAAQFSRTRSYLQAGEYSDALDIADNLVKMIENEIVTALLYRSHALESSETLDFQ